MKNILNVFVAVALCLTASMAMAKKANPNYSQFKKECLTETPNLKGKLLQKCIKEKERK